MPPRFTIVIPAARFDEARPVLESLRRLPAPGTAQTLVALGRHPARQRNAALARARGDVLVFLDNDCQLAPDFWPTLEAAFARPEVEVVGGPARLRDGAAWREKIFHALLSHPLVVGPLRARYVPVGRFRPSSQQELILCNLAVRRTLFEKIGLFSAELYPNEENEWLDRARAAGVGVFYDPALQVFRPQRATWTAFARTLVRYGAGRTRQFRVSGGKVTVHQLAPVVLLAPILALAWLPWSLLLFAAGWLLVALVVAATCPENPSLPQRITAGLTAPFVPLLYAWGQLIGWFQRGPVLEDEIRLVNEAGNECDAA